jgi:hypothetical protein
VTTRRTFPSSYGLATSQTDVPEIVKLRTLYCGQGGSDKIYGLAIVKLDNGFFRFFTFHGARAGGLINIMPRETAQSSGQLLGPFNKILREKERKYGPVDWQDQYYNMVDTVKSLGTPPGEQTAVPTSVPAAAPKPATRRAVKPQSQKTVPVFDRMADGLREF